MDTEKSPLLASGQPEKKLRSSYSTRWLVLMLSCLLMIGNYYCYDNRELPLASDHRSRPRRIAATPAAAGVLLSPH